MRHIESEKTKNLWQNVDTTNFNVEMYACSVNIKFNEIVVQIRRIPGLLLLEIVAK